MSTIGTGIKSYIRFVAQDKAGFDSDVWNHIVVTPPEPLWLVLDGCVVSGFPSEFEIETACGIWFKPVAQHLQVFPTHDLAGLCPRCVSES